MINILLVIFLIECVIQVGLLTYFSWKDKENIYFFVYLHNKNPERNVIIAALFVGFVFVFAFVFTTFIPLIAIVGLTIIDAVYLYAMYLDYIKKTLKTNLSKYIK